MKKINNKPSFYQFFTVEISNGPILHVAAYSFGHCAWKVHQYINSLDTKESHAIINIRRNVSDLLF